MDYWPRLRLTVHDDTASLLSQAPMTSRWLFSTKGTRGLWEAPFQDDDWLVFGSETSGIAPEVLAAHPDRVLRIPQAPGERCLNLATSVGIALYEALRQRVGR
jgi:tRNA (cytidine/uridine-2'-O-)-methyltransferase